jgi:hypothetical protein
MQDENKETPEKESSLGQPVTVSFRVAIKNVPEDNVKNLKLELNYCLLQLAKKHSPEDILVNWIWY